MPSYSVDVTVTTKSDDKGLKEVEKGLDQVKAKAEEVNEQLKTTAETTDKLGDTALKTGSSLKSFNFADIIAGAKGLYSALNDVINSMSLTAKATMVASAAYAGWKIGTWINEVTGLRDAINTAAAAESYLTDAEAEDARIRIQLNSGIQMTNDTFRVFNTLSAEQRHGIIENAKAAGTLTLEINGITEAIKQMNNVAQQNTIQAMIKSQEATYKDYMAFYSMSKEAQISSQLLETRIALQSTQDIKERIKLQTQMNNLIKQQVIQHLAAEKAEAKPKGGVADTGASKVLAEKEKTAALNQKEAKTIDQITKALNKQIDAILETEEAERKLAKSASGKEAAQREAENKIVEVVQTAQNKINTIRAEAGKLEVQTMKTLGEQEKKDVKDKLQQQAKDTLDYIHKVERFKDLLLKDTKLMNKQEIKAYKAFLAQELAAFRQNEDLKQAYTQKTAQIDAMTTREKVDLLADTMQQTSALMSEAFEKNKKMQMAAAIINTAGAIISAANTAPFMPLGLIAMILAAAAGAIQIAKISSTNYSAEGGMDIPAGLNPTIQAHEKEMVLPKEQADVIRGLASRPSHTTTNYNQGAGSTHITTPVLTGADAKIASTAIAKKMRLGERLRKRQRIS